MQTDDFNRHKSLKIAANRHSYLDQTQTRPQSVKIDEKTVPDELCCVIYCHLSKLSVGQTQETRVNLFPIILMFLLRVVVIW